jgi:Fe-S-cluster containining protein
MSAFVELKIAGQPRRIEFEMPEGAARPSALLPVLRKFSDAMVAAAEAAATEPVSCTKGCGACCRQLVPIREMEARRLAEFVRALPEPRRGEILARFAVAAGRLRESGMRGRLDARASLDQPGRVALKLDYFALGIACPFLEEESCGIYHERPMICREHLVTTPAAWCANPREGTIRTLPMRRADSAAAKLEARPDRPEWIPLIDLLDWVDAHRAEEGASRDPREMLQEFLRDLSR